MIIDLDEAMRYLGVREDSDGAIRRAMAATAHLLMQKVTPRWVWRLYPLERGEKLQLGDTGIALTGRSAAKMLESCTHAAVLCVTLGAEFDGLMRATQVRDMARAAMLDALGSAMVEAACDQAETEISARLPGKHRTDRFSPGYGDLPIQLQPEIIRVLDAQRRLGVTVTKSCMMIPQKTVTAIAGLSDSPQRARIRGCAYCAMNQTCELRKGGKRCDL